MTGTSRIWLNKLRCNGGETKLCDCSHTDWGKQTCSHGNVVGIRCGGNGVALASYSLPKKNLVFYHSQTIYFPPWMAQEVINLCRQLVHVVHKIVNFMTLLNFAMVG